jgi:dihydrodipicolinate synthase/N-acetylneuraminate lyase
MSDAAAVPLRGVVPIIPTPFRADESIDEAGLAACVRFAVRCGVGAVCLPAYASEFYKLTEAERFSRTTPRPASRRTSLDATNRWARR